MGTTSTSAAVPAETAEVVGNRTAEAVQAARMYYFQDLTMAAIGRELGVSRSTVSRLIGHARSAGLVEIRITSPQGHGPHLEQVLAEAHGVRAHVVPVDDSLSDLDRLDTVATFAARLLGSFFDSDMVLGLAWGTTLSAVSRHLAPKRTHNAHVVQLNGAANTRTTGISYASDIVRSFATAFQARPQEFPVPAFFDHPETRTHLWRERSISRVLDLQHRMDVAVFSIGAVDGRVPSHVYSAGYLEDHDVVALRADGVVGDIATVFFRGDGSWEGIALNERASGPELGRLRTVPRRLCVISGEAKLAGLRGALAGGLITDLVLDDTTAARLAET